jgi:Mrp family chromosome partitioning ATPase
MNDTTDASAILAPLWKRKWLILIVAVLVAAAAYYHYKHQPTTYSASTQINLASGAEEQALLSGQSKAAANKSAIVNAASIISSSLIAEEAHKLLRAEHAKAGKGKVRAKASATGSAIITITAEEHGAKAAARVANAYAVAYIRREHAAYVRAIRKAISNTHQQLRRVERGAASGSRGKGAKGPSTISGAAVIQAANLNSKLNQLESEISIQGIQQISPAKSTGAELIGPMPKKNAIFGFVFGLLLASIAAFGAERFDRSLRSLARVEQTFRSPILAALPTVRSPIKQLDGQPAVAKPLLEPIRRVLTTLRLREAPAHETAMPRVMVCTSADAGDGKSTVVAALALVMRDAGQRVAVIETDFRRPVLTKLLGVSGGPGLVDVLAGAHTLDEAVLAVPAPAPAAIVDAAALGGGGSTALRSRTSGSVSVLLSGGAPDNPPSLTDYRMADLIHSMSEDFDCVLIDAPSPLEVSDTISLLSAADGILVVARVRHTRDVSAERLVELLSLPSTAPVLGTVVNDVPIRELRRSGLSTQGRRRWPPSLPGR